MGQKATRLILRQIDFHFVRLNFQRDLKWYRKKNTVQHEVASPVLVFGTRFYTFSLLGDRFSFEMWRFSLRSNVTLCEWDWKFQLIDLDFMKFTFILNFHSVLTKFFLFSNVNRLSILYKKNGLFSSEFYSIDFIYDHEK